MRGLTSIERETLRMMNEDYDVATTQRPSSVQQAALRTLVRDGRVTVSESRRTETAIAVVWSITTRGELALRVDAATFDSLRGLVGS